MNTLASLMKQYKESVQLAKLTIEEKTEEQVVSLRSQSQHNFNDGEMRNSRCSQLRSHSQFKLNDSLDA